MTCPKCAGSIKNIRQVTEHFGDATLPDIYLECIICGTRWDGQFPNKRRRRWSTDPPTQSGWYWLKEETEKHIVWVFYSNAYGVYCADSVRWHSPLRVSAIKGKWSGPLVPPEG